MFCNEPLPIHFYLFEIRIKNVKKGAGPGSCLMHRSFQDGIAQAAEGELPEQAE